MENIYTILPTNNRRARIIAFILACIIYLLLIAALLVELRPILEQKYNDYFSPPSQQQKQQQPSQIPSTAQQQRATAAPVKYMPQPPKQVQPQTNPTPTPPAQLPQPTPALQQPDIQPDTAHKKQKPKAEKELPKRPEPIIQQPAHEEVAEQPKTPPHKPAQNSETSDPNAPRMPRKRLREKFYKNGRMPEQTSLLNHPTTPAHKPAAAQLAQGFSDHMYQQQAYESETALINGENNKGHEGALESQLFMHKFAIAFCNHSFNNQLNMHTSLIQPHRIELMITVSKDRKVKRVRFIKTSYDDNINEYIRSLLTTMMTPQLPASVTTPETTFSITIELERVYNTNAIYFVPGNSKRRGY